MCLAAECHVHWEILEAIKQTSNSRYGASTVLAALCNFAVLRFHASWLAGIVAFSELGCNMETRLAKD